MEGRERALKSFTVGFWESLFQNYCALICWSDKLEMKKFKHDFLTVSPAADPELIVWHNWGITFTSRLCRQLAYYIFQIFILVATFMVVTSLENYNLELEKSVPTTPCPKVTKELEAW